MICCGSTSAAPNRADAEARIAPSGPRHPNPSCRWRDLAGCIVPTAILALLPKCPACLAAYFALAGGIGISISTATYLRLGLIILCVTALTYLAVTAFSRAKYFAQRTAPGTRM